MTSELEQAEARLAEVMEDVFQRLKPGQTGRDVEALYAFKAAAIEVGRLRALAEVLEGERQGARILSALPREDMPEGATWRGLREVRTWEDGRREIRSEADGSWNEYVVKDALAAREEVQG